jgi:hypothetical protein
VDTKCDYDVGVALIDNDQFLAQFGPLHHHQQLVLLSPPPPPPPPPPPFRLCRQDTRRRFGSSSGHASHPACSARQSVSGASKRGRKKRERERERERERAASHSNITPCGAHVAGPFTILFEANYPRRRRLYILHYLLLISTEAETLFSCSDVAAAAALLLWYIVNFGRFDIYSLPSTMPVSPGGANERRAV